VAICHSQLRRFILCSRRSVKTRFSSLQASILDLVVDGEEMPSGHRRGFQIAETGLLGAIQGTRARARTCGRRTSRGCCGGSRCRGDRARPAGDGEARHVLQRGVDVSASSTSKPRSASLDAKGVVGTRMELVKARKRER